MYNSVEEYLQEKRKEAAEREKKQRNQFLYRENLMERIYADEADADSKAYPYFDSVKGKRYKLRFLPMTDEQYEEIKQYTGEEERVDDTLPPTPRHFGWLFGNVGRKIRTVAVVFFCIGIFLSVLYGIVIGDIITDDGSYFGSVVEGIVMAVGSIFSWLGSLTLYGFGQLIENSDKLVTLKQRESSKK